MRKLFSLSVLLLIGVTHISAQAADMQCEAKYYPKINSFFSDCFYTSDQVLRERQERFFEGPLARDCHTEDLTQYASLDRWNVPSSLLNGEVDICDFYEIGTGYVFTNIGAEPTTVVIEEKALDPKNDEYRNMPRLDELQNVDWSQLKDLINAYCQKANQTMAGANYTGPLDEESVFMFLAVNWTQYYQESKAEKPMSKWNKATYKKWLLRYQDYENQFQAFVAAHSQEQAQKVEKIWLDEYDDMALADILDDLDSRGVLSDFQDWYKKFFGANGLVEKMVSQQEQAMQVSSSSGIPVGMEDIVSWITNTMEMQLEKQCEECQLIASGQNISQSEVGAPSPTPREAQPLSPLRQQNQTEQPSQQPAEQAAPAPAPAMNMTLPSVEIDNFALPDTCNETADAVGYCCVDPYNPPNEECFEYSGVEQFFQSFTVDDCAKIFDSFNACITDLECFREAMRKEFISQDLEVSSPEIEQFAGTAYDLLQLNQNALIRLYNFCNENATDVFRVELLSLEAGFERPIGV